MTKLLNDTITLAELQEMDEGQLLKTLEPIIREYSANSRANRMIGLCYRGYIISALIDEGILTHAYGSDQGHAELPSALDSALRKLEAADELLDEQAGIAPLPKGVGVNRK